MHDPIFWQTMGFIIIGIFFFMFIVLDGVDFAIAFLNPFIAKKQSDKDLMINLLAPYWDGNEVWVIMGGGLLFALYSVTFAAALSGMYSLIMVVLLCFTLRAVSFECSYHHTKPQFIWQIVFAASSIAIPFLLADALGICISGVPIDSSTGTIRVPFLMAFMPFPLYLGLFAVIAIISHGSSYAALKTDDELSFAFRKVAKFTSFISLLFIGAFPVWAHSIAPHMKTTVYLYSGFALATLGAILCLLKLSKPRLTIAFIGTSLVLLGSWIMILSLHFPTLVADAHALRSYTIFNSSNSQATLQLMIIFALIAFAPICIGNAFVYKTFKKKIPETSHN